MPEHQTVGLVVAGAAARGAYEAGALSVLIPELADLGKRPTVMVGSSAGGINAFLLAQYSHLEAHAAVKKIVDVWAHIELSNVLSPILPTALGTGVLSLAEFLGIPGVRLKRFFDTAPLRATVEQLFDADLLHRNIQEGRVRTLALVATASNGRTTVFVESTAGVPLPPTDKDRAIDYVASTIEPAHVLASAAIPVLFPPIFVKDPDEARGWYRDGLVRLNAPIKPALALDAKQLALVASDPDTYSSSSSATPSPAEEEEPDIGDAGSQLLRAVLVDHMVEDIRKLRTVNQLVNQLMKDGPHMPIKKNSGRLYQSIDHIFVGPSEPGIIGNLAENHFEKHYDSGWRFWSPFTLIGRLLGSNSESRGELLSWLFFDPEFMQELIKMGKADAQRRLQVARESGTFPFNNEFDRRD